MSVLTASATLLIAWIITGLPSPPARGRPETLTVKYSASVMELLIPAQATLALPGFDERLGTLVEARWTGAIGPYGVFGIENLGHGHCFNLVWSSIGNADEVHLTDTTFVNLDPCVQDSTIPYLEPFDGQLDYEGPSGFSQPIGEDCGDFYWEWDLHISNPMELRHLTATAELEIAFSVSFVGGVLGACIPHQLLFYVQMDIHSELEYTFIPACAATTAFVSGHGTPANVGDCNQNGVSDDCEPDHDSDGIIDECDEDCRPGSDKSDLNKNGVADECEDCNGNRIPDFKEILSDPTLDSDGNWILDECDCDGDGVYDSLEVAMCPMLDYNFNGLLDCCEFGDDCNANGIPDLLEIEWGLVEDMNQNLVPDPCEGW